MCLSNVCNVWYSAWRHWELVALWQGEASLDDLEQLAACHWRWKEAPASPSLPLLGKGWALLMCHELLSRQQDLMIIETSKAVSYETPLPSALCFSQTFPRCRKLSSTLPYPWASLPIYRCEPLTLVIINHDGYFVSCINHCYLLQYKTARSTFSECKSYSNTPISELWRLLMEAYKCLFLSSPLSWTLCHT